MGINMSVSSTQSEMQQPLLDRPCYLSAQSAKQAPSLRPDMFSNCPRIEHPRLCSHCDAFFFDDEAENHRNNCKKRMSPANGKLLIHLADLLCETLSSHAATEGPSQTGATGALGGKTRPEATDTMRVGDSSTEQLPTLPPRALHSGTRQKEPSVPTPPRPPVAVISTHNSQTDSFRTRPSLPMVPQVAQRPESGLRTAGSLAGIAQIFDHGSMPESDVDIMSGTLSVLVRPLTHTTAKARQGTMLIVGNVFPNNYCVL